MPERSAPRRGAVLQERKPGAEDMHGHMPTPLAPKGLDMDVGHPAVSASIARDLHDAAFPATRHVAEIQFHPVQCLGREAKIDAAPVDWVRLTDDQSGPAQHNDPSQRRGRWHVGGDASGRDRHILAIAVRDIQVEEDVPPGLSEDIKAGKDAPATPPVGIGNSGEVSRRVWDRKRDAARERAQRDQATLDRPKYPIELVQITICAK